jgi:hypothetical protein
VPEPVPEPASASAPELVFDMDDYIDTTLPHSSYPWFMASIVEWSEKHYSEWNDDLDLAKDIPEKMKNKIIISICHKLTTEILCKVTLRSKSRLPLFMEVMDRQFGTSAVQNALSLLVAARNQQIVCNDIDPFECLWEDTPGGYDYFQELLEMYDLKYI